MKAWTTKDGTEIPIENLGDSHLLNCIKLLERRAKKGVTEYFGNPHIKPYDCDYETYTGIDALNKMPQYKPLLAEARKRKLTR